MTSIKKNTDANELVYKTARDTQILKKKKKEKITYGYQKGNGGETN